MYCYGAGLSDEDKVNSSSDDDGDQESDSDQQGSGLDDQDDPLNGQTFDISGVNATDDESAPDSDVGSPVDIEPGSAEGVTKLKGEHRVSVTHFRTVICLRSYVFCHMSFVTCLLSHVFCHMSSVTCLLSHVFCHTEADSTSLVTLQHSSSDTQAT